MRTQTEQKGKQQATICNWEAMPTQETPGKGEEGMGWTQHILSEKHFLTPSPDQKKKKTELWLFQSKLEVR